MSMMSSRCVYALHYQVRSQNKIIQGHQLINSLSSDLVVSSDINIDLLISTSSVKIRGSHLVFN